MAKKKYVAVNVDPDCVGYRFLTRTKNTIIGSSLKLGKKGIADGYNAQTINAGLQDKTLVSFISITDKGGLEKIITSNSTPSSSEDEVVA